MPALDLTAALSASSDLPDTSKPTGAVMVGGWMRAEFTARWRMTERLALTAALDNAFDQTYAEAVGFTAPGRRLRVGMQSQF
jgi:outer membrane receptor protein involved in Fe transport